MFSLIFGYSLPNVDTHFSIIVQAFIEAIALDYIVIYGPKFPTFQAPFILFSRSYEK